MSLKILEIFGSPAAGKTFMANQLQAALTSAGVNSLYVHEFIKDHAVRKLPITPDDQLWVAGNQFRIESACYGLPPKYSVIITDSPVSLAGFYAYQYSNRNPAYLALTDAIRQWQGIADEKYSNERLRFRIQLKQKFFKPEGRFEETFEEAQAVDESLTRWMNMNQMVMDYVPSGEKETKDWLGRIVDSLK